MTNCTLWSLSDYIKNDVLPQIDNCGLTITSIVEGYIPSKKKNPSAPIYILALHYRERLHMSTFKKHFKYLARKAQKLAIVVFTGRLNYGLNSGTQMCDNTISLLVNELIDSESELHSLRDKLIIVSMFEKLSEFQKDNLRARIQSIGKDS